MDVVKDLARKGVFEGLSAINLARKTAEATSNNVSMDLPSCHGPIIPMFHVIP